MKQEFTRSEQITLLRHIGGIYRKSETKVNMKKDEIADGDVIYYEDSFAHDINLVLSKMQERYARIIKHDFLVVEKTGWWKEYYPQSTYYRYKNIALAQFFHYL